MPFDTTDGMIRHTRLQNEPREYLERREELRRAEAELMAQSEKVAAGRGDWYARLDYGVDVHWGAYPAKA